MGAMIKKIISKVGARNKSEKETKPEEPPVNEIEENSEPERTYC